MNSAISFSAALLCASRAAARCSSLFASAFSMHSSLRGTSTGEPATYLGDPEFQAPKTHHSSASMEPSWSVSIAARAASRRDGTNRCWRFLLPQSVRNLITSLFARTAVTCE